MLRIVVPACEFYDESKEEFITVKEQTLLMEHSLISISKWEAKWKKPYLTEEKKTVQEIYDYFKCMTVNAHQVDERVYQMLTKENMEDIAKYVDDPMTATTIMQHNSQHGKREVMTSEVIYYYMIAQNIPVEFEKWHINRLLTLIKVCAIKNDPNPKKMSKASIAKQNRALNAARRKRLGTRG